MEHSRQYGIYYIQAKKLTRFAIRMMKAMVDGPTINATLVANRIGYHEPKPEYEMGFIGSVRPQPVCAHCDTITRNRPKHLSEQYCLRGTVLDLKKTHNSSDMDNRKEDDVRPVHVSFVEMIFNQTGNIGKHFPGQIQWLGVGTGCWLLLADHLDVVLFHFVW